MQTELYFQPSMDTSQNFAGFAIRLGSLQIVNMILPICLEHFVKVFLM